MWAFKRAQFRTGGGSGLGGDSQTGASSGLKGNRDILSSPLNDGGAVFEREKRVLARHYLDEGVSRAEVARRVGIGRRTLYNWIAGGLLEGRLGDQKGGYGPRQARGSKLDPFKGIIRARLAEYPELSAARLFEEVRAAGYPGGYDQVKRHVREVRPREPAERPVRFETPPGHQGQVDFAEFRLPWGRRHALMVVLGYSRRMWLRFYERQTMGVVIHGLEESFACFGGVPAEMRIPTMPITSSDKPITDSGACRSLGESGGP